MASIPNQHRGQAPDRLTCTVLTISDTRSIDDDSGGATLIRYLEEAGHHVGGRAICPDEKLRISGVIEQWRTDLDPDAILLTGGTGVSSRDMTFETIEGMLTKALPGYGELFRMLSYQEIGAAAMMSRAIGGLIGRTVVLTMPGSPKAVELAMEKLIVPELAHLVQQARK